MNHVLICAVLILLAFLAGVYVTVKYKNKAQTAMQKELNSLKQSAEKKIEKM